jgi:hypothetical protein
MPDNIPISPGQGATIATDQDPVTGAHYQRVKLMDGTEGSSDPIVSNGDGRLQVRTADEDLLKGGGGSVQITNDQTQPVPVQLDRYGRSLIATNVTPGTAQAYNVQAAFSDTTPLLYIQNNDSKANPFGKRMYLDYIKLICTVVPASATGARFAVKTDPQLRTISTNNTLAITPTSPNSDVATQSVCSVNAQNNGTASVLTASSGAARLVANASMGGIPEDHPKQTQWAAFGRRLGLRDLPPLPLVGQQIADFLMPVLFAAGTANSVSRTWAPGGPWVERAAITD